MEKGVSETGEYINNTMNIVQQDNKVMIEVDGTEKKSEFGGSNILRVSLPVCKIGVVKQGIFLYHTSPAQLGTLNSSCFA